MFPARQWGLVPYPGGTGYIGADERADGSLTHIHSVLAGAAKLQPESVVGSTWLSETAFGKGVSDGDDSGGNATRTLCVRGFYRRGL